MLSTARVSGAPPARRVANGGRVRWGASEAALWAARPHHHCSGRINTMKWSSIWQDVGGSRLWGWWAMWQRQGCEGSAAYNVVVSVLSQAGRAVCRAGSVRRWAWKYAVVCVYRYGRQAGCGTAVGNGSKGNPRGMACSIYMVECQRSIQSTVILNVRRVAPKRLPVSPEGERRTTTNNHNPYSGRLR